MAGREDPELARRLDHFVCVRLVQAWGLDLDVFWFDPSPTFAGVLLNAEGAVYGRFSARDLPTLAPTLDAALALHAKWPSNRAELEGNRGPALPWKRTSEVPVLAQKFGPAGLRGSGCLHCHDVRDGLVRSLEAERRPVPRRLSTPAPKAERLGFTAEPGVAPRVIEVQKGSAAERAGLKPGDRVRRLGGRPLLTLTDLEWALYAAPDEGSLEAVLERGGEAVPATLPLDKNWRNP